MPFKLVILYTDLLLFVMVAGLAGFAAYSMRHEHLRAPWRQVRRRPIAMSAMVILSFYILIGLADSIHVRLRVDTGATAETVKVKYSPQVVSLLDIVAVKLKNQTEKTYSAPFALNAFARETVETPEGPRRGYPRLKYGGSHLSSENERAGDLAGRILMAMVQTAICTGLAVLLLLAVIARRKQVDMLAVARDFARGNLDTPWRAIIITLSIVLFFLLFVVNVSPYYHVLGTDQVGNDVLYKAVKSIRTGLLIGTLTTIIMLPFALMLGISAGYFRGWIDDVVQYLYTTLNSIPGVLLIAAAILSLDVYMANHPENFTTLAERSDVRLLFLCIILGITEWTGLCRLVRGETLKLREMDYVQASVALGVNPARVMSRHILPNLMHLVLISLVLGFSGLVLAEAILSYIGVGVDPTMDSWGNMINGARMEMARDPMVWWSLAAAFVFMFGLVISANLFSDAVRDAFDPRIRKR